MEEESRHENNGSGAHVIVLELFVFNSPDHPALFTINTHREYVQKSWKWMLRHHERSSILSK